MHPNEAAGLALIALTAAVTLMLAGLAFGAWRQTGSRKLLPVMFAFLLFGVKSILTGYSLHTEFLHHEDLELVNTLFDLTIALLLVTPFIPLRRKA